MGLWNKFVSWLTGRDEKEHEVYTNIEKVDQVRSEIHAIAYTKVGNAQDEFYDALNRLNSVNGLSQYVGTVQTSNYNTVFESLTKTIDSIGDAIDEKAQAIKKYEESEWYEKVGSTISMAVCKIGEGLLSVVEDLGDGIVSVVGWVAPKDSGLEKWCGDFVKKEWSHDAFNFYYNSDFAKASAFTEDSGLAGGFKILGKTAGYLFAGGVMAGTGVASAAGAALHASTTTIGATMVAGVAGLGSGTESGLNNGKSFNDAFGQGVITGVTSAGFAFAGGKLSEGMAGRKYLRESGINKKATLKDGLSYIDDQATVGAASFKQGKEELKELAAVKGTKYANAYGKVHNQFEIQLGDKTSVQGYNDMFTNAGKNFKDSRNIKELAKINAKLTQNATTGQHENVIKQVLQSGDESLEGGIQSVSKSKEVFKSTDEIVENSTSGGVQDNLDDYIASKTAANTKTKIALSRPGNTGQNLETIKNIVSETGKSTLRTYGGTALGTTISASTQLRNAIHNETSQASAIQNAAKTQAITPVITSAKEASNATIATPTITTNRDYSYTPTQTYRNDTSTYTTRNAGSVTGTAPKVVAQVPTVSVGAATGTGASAASSAAKGAASLANLSGNWSDTGTGYTPKDMPTPGKVQPNTIKPGNGSVTPVPGSNGKTKSNVPITYHGGGEYNENGYVGDKNTSIAASIAGLTDDTDKVIDSIMNGSATKVPTSNKPISVGKKVGGSATIPLAAGLTTAAAAGLGAKAYSDYKRAQKEAEDEEYEDEFEEFDKDGIIEDGWTNEEIMKEMAEEDPNEKDFINIDKQDDDEYYRISENPLPITNDEDESFA